MILKNAKFHNLQDFVYWIRGATEQFGRRGGFNYLKTEIKAHYEFKKMGFLNSFEFIRNIMIRVFIRIMPIELRKKVYMLIWKIK